jgi:carboxypeptidase family protein
VQNGSKELKKLLDKGRAILEISCTLTAVGAQKLVEGVEAKGMLLLKSLCFRSFPSLAKWAQRRHFVALVALFLGISLQAFAQEATMVGTVTDPSGSVIANVKITITNAETGLVRAITTNESGQYVVPDLHIGHYNVKAEATGFKVAEQKGILLQVGDRVRLDFQMQVGAASETITVEATPIRVQTDTGEISNLITGQQLAQLAVNGTSLFQLAALTPGASSNITNYKDVPVGGDTSVSFNGQRTAHNVFLLDGGEDYDRGCGGCVTTAPSTDAIAEFRQLTSNYSADYGLSSAGTVTMVVKSGASALHASAWEFNRNDAFDARNFFFPAPNKKQELRMNIFGFNVSGPVTFGRLYNPDKKKTFFFYNMEWRKYIDGGSTNQSVPDTKTYGGDFSSVSTPIIVPSSSRVANSVLYANCPGGTPAGAGVTPGSPFPGNKIPTCMISPNATALLSAGIFPAPNTNISNGVGNFVGGANTPTNLREEIARIDHNFSSKFSVFGHFVAEQISQGYNTAQWSGDNLPTVGDTFNNPSYSAVMHATQTISTTLINEMAFNYNGNRIHIIPYAATGLKSLSLPTGYNSTNSRLFTGPNNLNRIPNITLDGGSGANFQIASWPWVNSANDYQIRDDVSWIRGAHQLKIGGSWALYKKVQDLFGTTQGAFTFTGKASNLTYTGNSFADFLLGTTCAGCTGYEELAVQDHGLWNNVSWAAYVQDNWRVNHQLTLNLGLRWDGVPHAYEANNRMGNFYPSLYNSADAATFDNFSNICSGPSDPGCSAASPGLGTSPNKILAGVPLYLNGIGIPGQNGVPKGLVNNHWAAFGPRLGFAYDLTGSGKTVVRGGFGIMYERIQGNDMYNAGSNIPFSLDVQLNSVEFQNPNILLATGAAPTFQTIKAANITGLAIGNYKLPTSSQYSAGVQHSFGPKTILSVSYVGNLNRHLNDYRNINLPSPSDLVTLNSPNPPFQYQTTPSIPYHGFRTLSLAANEANAHYNSLQVDLNSQVGKDLQLRAFYTLSRAIDPSTGGSGQDLNPVSNPYKGWVYDVGPSIFDRTHVVSVNFIYDIPVLRHSSSHLVKSTVGGWQISGIVIAESGLPINITAGGGNIVGGGNRPNLTGTISYPHTVLPGNQVIQYFDPTAFTAPAAGTWGTLGHNALRGPGRDNWNLSLFKTFTFSETRGSRFELRLETFNTWNHTQFNNVDNNLGDNRFGQFTSAYDARILQLAGKFYF